MRLSELLAALPTELAPRGAPSADPVVRGIQYDSRAVAPGDLFVALRGAASDGHAFVAEAILRGAVAVLAEEPPARAGETALAIVPHTRRALAPIATAFFGAPSRELALIGVTGTNGKTSTTFLCESILRAAGRKPGLIGTVEVRFAEERVRATNTTPESLDLQRLLRDMCTRGVDAVAMEVSSHGLELGRVEGCAFRAAALTNVTQDHLDFHGTMEAYQAAKEKLFHTYLAPGGAAVVNVDEPRAEALPRGGGAPGGRAHPREPAQGRARRGARARRATSRWTGRARASRCPPVSSSWPCPWWATSTWRT